MGFKYTREGRLEVYYRNTWAAVCSNSWNKNAANVACRQLGMATVKSSNQVSAPVDQAYSAWLTSVSCEGDENTLSHCKNVVWDTRPCSNGKIVELSCNAGELFIFTRTFACVCFNGCISMFCGNGFQDYDTFHKIFREEQFPLCQCNVQ